MSKLQMSAASHVFCPRSVVGSGSIINDNLSLDLDPLSLDLDPLSLDSDPLSLDSGLLSLDLEPMSLDPDSLDPDPLALDPGSFSLDLDLLPYLISMIHESYTFTCWVFQSLCICVFHEYIFSSQRYLGNWALKQQWI